MRSREQLGCSTRRAKSRVGCAVAVKDDLVYAQGGGGARNGIYRGSRDPVDALGRVRGESKGDICHSDKSRRWIVNGKGGSEDANCRFTCIGIAYLVESCDIIGDSRCAVCDGSEEWDRRKAELRGMILKTINIRYRRVQHMCVCVCVCVCVCPLVSTLRWSLL